MNGYCAKIGTGAPFVALSSRTKHCLEIVDEALQRGRVWWRPVLTGPGEVIEYTDRTMRMLIRLKELPLQWSSRIDIIYAGGKDDDNCMRRIKKGTI